jgi:hypothetical protein
MILPSEACVLGAEALEGIIMVRTGASYQPELIELMKTALDEAASILPVVKQTSTMKVKLASRILSAAAQGVRDPIQLRVAALMEIKEVKDELHQCHAQLLRLRRRVEKAEAAQPKPRRPSRNKASGGRPRSLTLSPIKRARMSDPKRTVCEDSTWVCEDHADAP